MNIAQISKSRVKKKIAAIPTLSLTFALVSGSCVSNSQLPFILLLSSYVKMCEELISTFGTSQGFECFACR